MSSSRARLNLNRAVFDLLLGKISRFCSPDSDSSALVSAWTYVHIIPLVVFAEPSATIGSSISAHPVAWHRLAANPQIGRGERNEMTIGCATLVSPAIVARLNSSRIQTLLP